MKCLHTNRPVSNVVLILETFHLDLLYCNSVVLTFSIGLVKYRGLGLTPRGSDSVDLMGPGNLHIPQVPMGF